MHSAQELTSSAAAIHSFVFPTDLSVSPSIQTLPTEFPVLDYTLLPGSQDEILVTLDTTFGIVSFNQEVGQPPKREHNVTEEQKQQMHKSYRIIKVAQDGSVSLLFSAVIVKECRLIASSPIPLRLTPYLPPSGPSLAQPRTNPPDRHYPPSTSTQTYRSTPDGQGWKKTKT